MFVKTNLQNILTTIHSLESKYHRPPNTVTLIGASKKQSPDKILEAYNAGLTHFGENYLQEALDKIAVLPNDITWHFIGRPQRNKTRKIAEHFAWVHGIDDIRVAERLSEQRPEHLPSLNICIEVNINHETTKSGVSIDAVKDLANACAVLPKLHLRGLMAIPAPADTLEKQREQFRQLRNLKDQLEKSGLTLDTLSMGMSEDYEAAIAEGSTIVRIGTALFGARN